MNQVPGISIDVWCGNYTSGDRKDKNSYVWDEENHTKEHATATKTCSRPSGWSSLIAYPPQTNWWGECPAGRSLTNLSLYGMRVQNNWNFTGYPYLADVCVKPQASEVSNWTDTDWTEFLRQRDRIRIGVRMHEACKKKFSDPTKAKICDDARDFRLDI